MSAIIQKRLLLNCVFDQQALVNIGTEKEEEWRVCRITSHGENEQMAMIIRDGSEELLPYSRTELYEFVVYDGYKYHVLDYRQWRTILGLELHKNMYAQWEFELVDYELPKPTYENGSHKGIRQSIDVATIRMSDATIEKTKKYLLLRPETVLDLFKVDLK